MTGRMTAYGGWVIEPIVLDGVHCLRVARCGYLVGQGYYTDPRDLEQVLVDHGVDLAELEPDDLGCE